MMLRNLQLSHPRIALLTLLSFLTLATTACSSSEGAQPPVVVIDLTGDAGVGQGCSQPSFAADQPDLFAQAPPAFVTETGEPQRLVRPGQELLAVIPVNSATRQVVVEVSDAYSRRVILREELDTPGNQSIPVIFFTDPTHRGRFYMRVTLCAFDCDERQVIFDITDYDADVLTSGHNGNYERTLTENGEIVQVDLTCVKPNTVAIQ